jgi:hypothetical protein
MGGLPRSLFCAGCSLQTPAAHNPSFITPEQTSKKLFTVQVLQADFYGSGAVLNPHNKLMVDCKTKAWLPLKLMP